MVALRLAMASLLLAAKTADAQNTDAADASTETAAEPPTETAAEPPADASTETSAETPADASAETPAAETGAEETGTTTEAADAETARQTPAPASSAHCQAGWYGTDSTSDCCCLDVADSPSYWQDSRGYTCQDYSGSGSQYCTHAGAEGAGWWNADSSYWNYGDVVGWGPITDWTDSNGVTALVACCACGGGRRSEFNEDHCGYNLTAPVTSCQNVNPLWSDSSGRNCTSYAEEGWCTTSGDIGHTWQANWHNIEWWANDDFDGHSALDICCACGSDTKAERDAAAAEAAAAQAAASAQLSGARAQGPATMTILSATILFAALALRAGM